MISIFPLWTFHLYVEAGIKFNFSEFIFIFDLVLGFYCSGQKSRKNTEIKSYWRLIFFMKDGSIGTVLSHKSGMEINGRPWRVKFQLGDQILLCGRPVGEWNLFITPKFPLPTDFVYLFCQTGIFIFLLNRTSPSSDTYVNILIVGTSTCNTCSLKTEIYYWAQK